MDPQVVVVITCYIMITFFCDFYMGIKFREDFFSWVLNFTFFSR